MQQGAIKHVVMYICHGNSKISFVKAGLSVLLKMDFLISQSKHIVGAQNNHLNETVLLSTYKKF